jgi:hypothetical protein
VSRKKLIEYTRAFLPHERQEAAAQAWDARSEDPDAAKAIIGEFYYEAAAMAREDERSVDVRSLAEDHNAVLVSAIRSYGNLGPFRPQNREDFKGVRLFDILLRPGQIACCSTVVEGDTRENLYGDWGVIVGRGTIHQAFPYDAVTSVQQGQVYSKFAPRIEQIRPSEQLHQALQARQVYNEINASLDGIAGLFYCVDEGAVDDRNDFPSPVFQQLIEPLAIPQYLLRNGKFYSITDPQDIYENKIGRQIMPAEIVARNMHPTDQHRDRMVEYLSENLMLAPRNAITSGAARGKFAHDYQHITPTAKPERFFREQGALLDADNESLRVYGAMALYAFADAAEKEGETERFERAKKMAEIVLRYTTYEQYKSRILPSGNLLITQDDLRHYLETEELPDYLKDH